MAARAPEWLVVYAKGICMGAADAVPGVSGGTIALIVGVYERLIRALTAIDPDRIKRVLGGAVSDRPDAVTALREMDVGFLLALGVGVVTAVVAITSLVEHAIDAFPVLTFGFFFGLIAASAFVLRDSVSLDTSGRMGAAIAGFALAFVVSGSFAGALGHALPVVFVAGAIAVSAMILPGVSGSLLLLILGQYEFMTGELSGFTEGLLAVFTGGTLDALIESGTVVVTFVAGAVVGLFTVAHAIRAALDRYREATLAFLVSLIVGALRAPVVRTAEAIDAWTPAALATFGALALAGGAVVIAVDWYAGEIEVGDGADEAAAD